jgi:hypothetical protein
MKRILTTVILSIFGMAVFAQDMSYYTTEYMRRDSTFVERLAILEVIRDENVNAPPEFYHDALKYLLERSPDVLAAAARLATEREAAEKSIIILAQALGAAKFTAAAPELWRAASDFDVVRVANNGHAQQAALIALGQVDGRAYLENIVQRLADYNAQTFRGENKIRVQVAVIGCISALEAFKDITGYEPVFYVYVGSYDPAIQQVAYAALPNIAEDPSDVLIGIIRDPSVTPPVKLTAWNERLRTNAPNESKARVAAAALEMGWVYTTSNRSYQANLRDMRKGAINAIRQFGASGDSVYADLERSYTRNFITNTPDYDEITATLNTLAELKTEQAVGLLLKFLRELDGRRRSGPWGDKERQIFPWVISSIAFTRTQNTDVILLLNTIIRRESYTPYEQGLARDALNTLRGGAQS